MDPRIEQVKQRLVDKQTKQHIEKFKAKLETEITHKLKTSIQAELVSDIQQLTEEVKNLIEKNGIQELLAYLQVEKKEASETYKNILTALQGLAKQKSVKQLTKTQLKQAFSEALNQIQLTLKEQQEEPITILTFNQEEDLTMIEEEYSTRTIRTRVVRSGNKLRFIPDEL